MRYQEATAVIGVGIGQLERRLADVRSWPTFLVGLEAVEPLGHERYLFDIVDGGDRCRVTTCVRHLFSAHRFTWRALEGPSYTGSIDLTPVDAGHTAVRISLAGHPRSLRAGLAEMLLPRTSLAALDLRRLDESLVSVR